ncbi:hypothetical protein Tco_0865145 [Tanacetum coccineum]
MIPPTTHIDTTPIPIVSPTIPPSPDYTPALPDYTPVSPDYSPISDTEFDPSEDPSSDHIPPLPATSPFLSSTDDSSDSDIPDTPPSPTHGTPFTDTTLSTQRSPIASGALRCRVMVLAPGQPIPHGRPYRYHLYNGPGHFSSDDSLTDSSSSSSSESSVDSFVDALSDSASSRSSFDHSSPTPSSDMRPSHHLCSLVPSIHYSYAAISKRPSDSSSSVSPSCKRSSPPAASVPLSSLIPGALSYARANLLPSPKRIRSLETTTDLEGCSEIVYDYRTKERLDWELTLRMRVLSHLGDRDEYERPVEVRVDRVTHPVVADDILEPAQEGDIEVMYETLGDLVQRFHDHTEEIPVYLVQLERDNMRLRDIMDVVSQRVARSQRRELRVQREMRQIWRFRFYDRMRIARLEACARRHLGYHS